MYVVIIEIYYYKKIIIKFSLKIKNNIHFKIIFLKLNLIMQ